MKDLRALADLLTTLNEVGTRISTLVGRPGQIGHVGEFIASRVFEIALESSASAKGIDGRFKGGLLVWILKFIPPGFLKMIPPWGALRDGLGFPRSVPPRVLLSRD